MPSRRKMLSLATLATLGLPGCSSRGENTKSVDLLLHNDDTEPWELTVVVSQETGEEVFEATETVPVDDGVNLGEIRIDSAFDGVQPDIFTVRTRLNDEPAGTFEYRVTCPNDNYIALLIEHHSNHSDGELVQYNAHQCSN